LNRLVALAACLAVATLLAATFTASYRGTEEDSAFVAGGRGAQAALDEGRLLGVDVQRLVSSPAALGLGVRADPRNTVLVVSNPLAPYTPTEAAAVADWVAQGNHLLVADDTGQAHTLTAPYGIAFERVRLVSGPGEWSATLGRDRFDLAPVHPTGLLLQPGVAAQVLASSPADSFLDRDGDGVIAVSDPRGSFPFAARVEHGAGSVFAVADSGLFTAEGALAKENRAFVAALLGEALPEGGLVLIDESRSTSDPLLAAAASATSAAATPGWRAGLTGLAVALLVGLCVPAALRQWRAHRFNPNRFRSRASLVGERAGPEPLPKGGWTQRGGAAALLAGALCIGAFLWGSQQAAIAGSVLLVALGLAATARVPALRARRETSGERLDESAELAVSLELTARHGRTTDLEFQDRLPETFEVREGTNWFQASLQRDAPLRLTFQAAPALRGPHVVGPLLARSSDPLGLRVDQAILLEGTPVRVNPRRESVRKLPFRTRIPTATLGPHLVNRAGDGSEFHALRSYQSGDSFRAVNWKASARSRTLMVNQRVHESMTRLTLFLDARAVSAAGPAASSPLAHGCRAALSVASGALRMRDRLRVVVYGDGVQELPALPGSRQLHQFTEVLAALDAKGETTFAQALDQVLPTLRPGTPILVASGLEGDATIPDALRTARAKGLQPVVLASPLGLHPVDGEAPSEADAEAISDRRAQTVSSIQALGVPVFDAVANVPLDLLFRTGGT
jgi:uncharacterized protein (DUF58 family)